MGINLSRGTILKNEVDGDEAMDSGGENESQKIESLSAEADASCPRSPSATIHHGTSPTVVESEDNAFDLHPGATYPIQPLTKEELMEDYLFLRPITIASSTKYASSTTFPPSKVLSTLQTLFATLQKLYSPQHHLLIRTTLSL